MLLKPRDQHLGRRSTTLFTLDSFEIFHDKNLLEMITKSLVLDWGQIAEPQGPVQKKGNLIMFLPFRETSLGSLCPGEKSVRSSAWLSKSFTPSIYIQRGIWVFYGIWLHLLLRPPLWGSSHFIGVRIYICEGTQLWMDNTWQGSEKTQVLDPSFLGFFPPLFPLLPLW